MHPVPKTVKILSIPNRKSPIAKQFKKY